MEAHAKSLTFIGNEGKICIPFFQRGYVWDKKNWDDLLSELLNFKRNHFLGSVILKQLKVPTGAIKEVLVIDGQQRLTTLSILVKVLYDLFSDELKEITKPSINTHLFFKKNQTDKNYIIKLQHSHIDSVAYKLVIETAVVASKFDEIGESSNKILQCYKYFYENLVELDEAIRVNLFNWLLNDENKILVVIDLTEKDNEQAIFDTINSAGVRLSSADIIKNAIFQKALLLYGKQDLGIDLYNKTWNKTFLTDNAAVNFWDSERATGRLMRDNIEILLHSIAVIQGFYDPDEHTLSDIGDLYKIKINSLDDIDSIELMTTEICEYANLYREYIANFDATSLLGYQDTLRRLLHILDCLQITTFHPLLLFVLKTYKDDSEKDDIFQSLEKYIVRRMITNADTKGYNKICKEFIDRIENLKTKSQEVPDILVDIGLMNISNKTAAILLFWIELYRRKNDNKYDVKELKYSYSLEHIMPQKWEPYWTTFPTKLKSDGSVMNPIEAKQDRYEKIYWIGNMTLLTTSLNSSLKNYDFCKKVEGEGRKKGVKQYAHLSITKDDIVGPYENGDHVWDEVKIMQRTQKLSAEILSIW